MEDAPSDALSRSEAATGTPPYMEQLGGDGSEWGIRKLAQFGNQQLYFIE